MDNCELLKSLYDYKCTAAECLDFVAGDYFYLYQLDSQQPEWWQVITIKGQLGLIPCNFVCTEKVETDFYISFLNLATQYLSNKVGKTEDEQEALAKLTCKSQQMKQLFNCKLESAERRELKTTMLSPPQECGYKPKLMVETETAVCKQIPRETYERRSFDPREPPSSACQRQHGPRSPSHSYDECKQIPRAACEYRRVGPREPPSSACQRQHVPRSPSHSCDECKRSQEKCESRERKVSYDCRPKVEEMRPACEKPKVEKTCTRKVKAECCEDPSPFYWCEYGVVVILAMGLLVGVAIMTVIWVVMYREGYSWKEEPERHFNLHPTLMVIGFITFSGIAILLFRIFRRCRHVYVKLLHALFHAVAAPCIAVGYIATWDSHNLNRPPVPHFYSLHSWLGLATMGLFVFQYACAFFTFLFLLMCHESTSAYRASLVPVHVALGVLTFVLAVCCCLTGITEIAFFTLRARYVALPGEGIFMNSIGLILLVILALVVCILMPKTYSHGNRERGSKN